MEKLVKKYAKLYRTALKANSISDIDLRIDLYEQRLKEMYGSRAFKVHNVYPTMDVSKIYAVIAMCLELRQDNYSDEEIIDIVNSGFAKLRKAFMLLEKIIDSLPFAYQIAKKWNIADHESRVKDGSITYDYFNVSEGKVEYRISKCMYIELFEYYGIRSLCKIFCITDETAYSNLTKHVKFIRHSDLSCGDCCHDEVIDKGYLKE
jgi:hypothetical protein